MLVPVHVSPFQGFDFGGMPCPRFRFAPPGVTYDASSPSLLQVPAALGTRSPTWGARACDAALDNGLFGGLFDFFLGAGTVPDLEVVEGAMEWESSRWRMDAERSLECVELGWIVVVVFGDDGFAIDV